MNELVFFSGLPRSGSTLICNLLGEHEDISVTSSSPLNQIVQNMKRMWSDDPFLLSQLDNNFDIVYKKLEDSTRAFIETYSENGTKITIDKNRGWLTNVEFVRSLYPNFKMIVCLRDPRQIFASVEKAHKKTSLLDFPDHMDANDVNNRANILFDNNGIIGSCLKAVNNLQDIPNIMPHLFFFRYEDFLQKPQETMDSLFKWLGLETKKIDFNNMKQYTFESDSYYRMKFCHKIKTKLENPKTLETTPISPRILDEIFRRYEWFYKTYYPELVSVTQSQKEQTISNVSQISNNNIEEQVASEIDDVLKKNKKVKK